MSPAARWSYELHETPHELRTSPPRVPLRAGEIAAIMGFWAFLGALSAAGRLINPRGPELSPEVASGLLTLSFAEYSIWAVLTVPIFMLAHRFTVTAETGRRRIVLFMALGLVIAILVDALLAQVRMHVLPPPPGRFRQPPSLVGNLLRFQFLYDYMVYLAVFAAALARDYFLRYQARLEETTLLQAQAAKLEAQLADARLTALRSQLNPHFLFNTLNAISMLALEGNHTAVVETIARLRELLRVSLSHDRPQEVSLARELKLVEGYLGIQRVRFTDRLTVAYDIAPSVVDAVVPSMILQPLVENAVIHGISADTGSCRVAISAARDGSWLRLEVRDTGPGFASTDSRRREGIGLVNTRARLQQLYGSEQRIDCFDAIGGGACVAIWIPFRTASLAA
jgi:two-component system, LytTR family, sensor kinase